MDVLYPEKPVSTRKSFQENCSFAFQLREAILKKQEGERKNYDFFLSVLAEGKVDSDVLLAYIDGFRSCVSLLSKDHETLVGIMLKMDWTSKEDKIIEAYISFLTELVSAQTFYVRGCLKMLVQKFMPDYKLDANLDNMILEDMSTRFSNVHKALFSVLLIVPTSPRHLLMKLCDLFPYVGKHQIFLQSYIKNLLYITKYMPTLQEKIFEIIIDNLLKIDVQISKHDIEEELNESDDELDADETQFIVEVEKDATENPHMAANNEMKNEPARKLDNLMLTMFESVEDACFSDGNIDWEKAEKLSINFLKVFEVVLLPTHASSYVQFIIFHICSIDQYFANSFLEFCWQRVCDPNVPILLRQTSAAYIGSFVARAKFIPGEVVRTCLVLFSEWIHSYLNVLDACVFPDLHKHATFYSVCQTLLYVFVFRHQDIIEEADWRVFVRKLQLGRIVNCRLNPLKFCLSSVVDMFARITRMHEIVFCYTILEHNKRSMLLSVSADARDKKNILDSFFPFDPYLLKKSGKVIKPLYQDWTGIEGDDDVVDKEDVVKDDNENENAVNCEKMDDTGISFSVSPGTPRFDWCISPGFHPALMKAAPLYEE